MNTIEEIGGQHKIAALIALDLPSFIEAAQKHPDDLVILREGMPLVAAELRRYCLALGGVRQFEQAGEVRAVKFDPSIPNSTAMSLDALPLHTDGTFLKSPPQRFMLSFVTRDEGGRGASTLIPVSRILAAAPDWVLDALFEAEFLFVRSYDGDLTDSFVGPVLYRNPPEPTVRVRWRSDNIWRPKVVEPNGTRADAAVDWLHEFLCNSTPTAYAAEPGETLLVPNTVMLHGRTSLSPMSSREVLRAWVA